MPYGTINVDKVVDTSGGVLAPISSVFRNRLINGNMVIDQRNAGASVTASAVGAYTYTVDRWAYLAAAASKFTVQQNAGSVTPPTGFTNYLGVTSSAATTVGASDYYLIKQPIEGFNTADFGFGTAGASTVTLSFWVRSSLTGTFGGSLFNNDANRFYPFSYTISSANTWEQKSITIAGDTTGTWAGATNGTSINLCFGLGLGSSFSATAGAWGTTGYSATGATNVVSTNGATFYITGVQLEKGSTATSFDYRPYGTELALCQRYFYKNIPASANGCTFGIGIQTGTTNAAISLNLPVSMRSAPTLVQSDTIISDNTNFDANVTSLDAGYFTSTSGYANFGFSSAGATNRAVLFRSKTSGNIGFISFSSEL